MVKRRQSVNTLATALLCGVALLACKQGAADDQAKPEQASRSDDDAKDDDRKPEEAKDKAPAPTPVAPAPASTNTAVAAADRAKFEVQSTLPPIPTTKSNPPQGTEWNDGVPINTQGANARGKNCRMMVLREWLNIYCTGDVIGYEKKEDFGTLNEDYYEQIVPGKFASFVLRLRPGHHPKIRICREQNRASLFVNWPPSSDWPLHVALGHGPPCDGSDWGAGYGVKGGTAVKAQPVPESEAAGYEALDQSLLDAAKRYCSMGVTDACNFACGSDTCP